MSSNLMYNGMFLYDWQRIFEKAEGNPNKIFRIFKMMVTNQIPINKYDQIYKYSHIKFIGQSFLVHPDVLLFNAYKHSRVEIAQYLALASLRPISDYLATGKTTLDINLIEMDPTFFNDNSLLDIDEDEMSFLYEEVPQEKKQWH